MSTPKIIFTPKLIANKHGYDVVIISSTATVKNYVDQMQDFFSHHEFFRERTDVVACKGCDMCCGERIPLTLHDMNQFLATFKNVSPSHYLQRYAYITVEGEVVDITLPLHQDGLCIHLDRNLKTCSIYEARPLTCLTFFCCPASPRAQKLRETIINAGEDALVRYWLQHRQGFPSWEDCHDAFDPCPVIQDYSDYDFNNLSNLLLRDLCPPNLWQQLYRGGQEV